MWNRVGGDNVESAPVTPMERQYSGLFFIGNNNGDCIERSEITLQQASATARGEATKR